MPELLRVRLTVDGKAGGHLRAFDGVAANQGAAGGVQFFHGTSHQAVQIPTLQFRVVPGQGHVGEGRVGRGVHGVQIAEAVQGGDSAEQVGLVNEGREIIQALHQSLVVCPVNDGRVVGGINAGFNAVAEIRL